MRVRTLTVSTSTQALRMDIRPEPWLLLQYGESDIEVLGSDRVESLLSESPDTDDREDIVIEEI